MWNWLNSFLVGRKQLTTVNGFSSSIRSVTYGVPQGSILGPLLFLVYINDIGFLPDVPFKPKLYADDTNMFVYSHSLQDLQLKAQDTLDKVSAWVAANRLTINVDKTCFMIFRPSSTLIDLSQFTLHLNSRVLSRVTSTKFLGVTIDDELTWTIHIQNLCLHLLGI